MRRQTVKVPVSVSIAVAWFGSMTKKINHDVTTLAIPHACGHAYQCHLQKKPSPEAYPGAMTRTGFDGSPPETVWIKS
jgi:hypothetical protein